MGGRGLSLEEKRAKLVEIFHETKDFFQLKELEKLAPKMKGIVSQSVKEVLQSLVDDGLVQMDKIGASNFFWSFPSQHGVLLAMKLARVQGQHDTLKNQLGSLDQAIEKEKSLRVISSTRTTTLERLAMLKSKTADLRQELKEYGACNPAQVEEKKRAVILAKEAAIRWTDNVFITLSHFSKEHNVDPADIKKHLGISDMYEEVA